MIKKYIIIKGHPILFPKEIIHEKLVSKIADVESAGFFMFRSDEQEHPNVICMGESASLSVRSRPEIDEKIISDFLKSEE